jgi:CheY-like chemotaxis protein
MNPLRRRYSVPPVELVSADDITRLAPVRVLLVGNDTRFLRVASALLAAQGHSVQSSERPGDLLELVHRLGTDVAVIDASASLAHAARSAASLRGLPVPVAAVLVADRERIANAAGLTLVPKWGDFDELLSSVEAAYEWRQQTCA